MLSRETGAQDVRAQDVGAQDVGAQDVRAQDLRALDLRASDPTSAILGAQGFYVRKAMSQRASLRGCY